MENYSTVVGMDVHKASMAGAVLPCSSDRVTERIVIENQPKAVERFATRVAARGPAVFVYEAGPCGYELHRQLAALGHRCVVIAPGLTPRRPGDKVKTDRRDAEKLARLYRAGELTTIRVPTREEEAARDLVRTREDCLGDRLRARHRLSKFFLRQGRVYRETKAWGVKHREWLSAQRFDWQPLKQTFESYMRAMEEAEARLETLDRQLEDLAQREPYRTRVKLLRALRGIDTLAALTLVVEIQEFQRFEKARGLMGYTGLVIKEDTTGFKPRRFGITKTGNAHVRRILVEAAWAYRSRGALSRILAKRREGCPPEVIRIAKKAEGRLHRKFWKLVSRGKLQQVAVVAAARELAGFIWSISRCFPEIVAA